MAKLKGASMHNTSKAHFGQETKGLLHQKWAEEHGEHASSAQFEEALCENILRAVLCCLPLNDLARAATVCKRWHDAASCTQVWQPRVHAELLKLLHPVLRANASVGRLVCDVDVQAQQAGQQLVTDSASAYQEDQDSAAACSSSAPSPHQHLQDSSTADTINNGLHAKGPMPAALMQHHSTATAAGDGFTSQLPHVGSFSAIQAARGLSLASLFRAVYGGVLVANPHFLERENQGGRVWYNTYRRPSPVTWEYPLLDACPPPSPTTHHSTHGLFPSSYAFSASSIRSGSTGAGSPHAASSSGSGGGTRLGVWGEENEGENVLPWLPVEGAGPYDTGCAAFGAAWGEVVQVIDLQAQLEAAGVPPGLAQRVRQLGLPLGLSGWITERPGTHGEVQLVALCLSEARFSELVAAGPAAAAAAGGEVASAQDHAPLLSLSLPPPGARLLAVTHSLALVGQHIPAQLDVPQAGAAAVPNPFVPDHAPAPHTAAAHSAQPTAAAYVAPQPQAQQQQQQRPAFVHEQHDRCKTVRMRSRGATLTSVGPVAAPSGQWRELCLRLDTLEPTSPQNTVRYVVLALRGRATPSALAHEPTAPHSARAATSTSTTPSVAAKATATATAMAGPVYVPAHLPRTSSASIQVPGSTGTTLAGRSVATTSSTSSTTSPASGELSSSSTQGHGTRNSPMSSSPSDTPLGLGPSSDGVGSSSPAPGSQSESLFGRSGHGSGAVHWRRGLWEQLHRPRPRGPLVAELTLSYLWRDVVAGHDNTGLW